MTVIPIAKRLPSASLLALALAGCVTTPSAQSGAATSSVSEDELTAMLGKMMAGESAVSGDALEAKLAEASEYPLGTRENPVRAQGPAGQRAYLARLRCSDTSRPSFYREGSAGVSPYGNIVDVYNVTCEGAKPAKSSIFIDMYHRGYEETEAVPGFGIAGGRAPE